MKYLPYIIIAVLILVPLFLMILFHFKKKHNIKKVMALSIHEKNAILDTLAKPLGFLYEPIEDIFATRLDAPQKIFGYTHFYDLSAPYFNMIFDYETIFFDYNSKTWLIEIWKGQYGISTGCELGIYCSDTILSPNEYKSELFHAVDANDMLNISLQLNQISPHNQQLTELAYQTQKHWWLTVFKPGIYTKPENLSLSVGIRFNNYAMLHSFYESLLQTLPHIPCRITGLSIYFNYRKSNRQYTVPRRLLRKFALTSCHLYCTLYNFITRPFSSCGDKVLYLYHYLPFLVRRMLRPKKK